MTSAVADVSPSLESPSRSTAGCLLCGGPVQPVLTVPGDWRRPQHRETYELVGCRACDFAQLQHRPSLDELVAAYAVDEYYTHDAPQRLGTGAGRLLDRLQLKAAWLLDRGVEAEIVAASLARHGVDDDATLCDVGCGNGGLLKRLSAAGRRVVGIEPDADARRTAQAAGLQVFAGSGEAIPAELHGTRFDVVTMTHVLEHVLDPAASVRNVAELLREGGLFFVETPNNACLGARRGGTRWRWLDVPRHLNFFTPESLQNVCRRAGLEIVAVEFTGYTRQFRADWIAEECEIERRLTGRAPGAARRAWRNLCLLASTGCAAPRWKYDSVRVVARRG